MTDVEAERKEAAYILRRYCQQIEDGTIKGVAFGAVHTDGNVSQFVSQLGCTPPELVGAWVYVIARFGITLWPDLLTHKPRADVLPEQ